ncbi:hypothetical protein GOBAR_DD01014 [Gossypium barbadense]|nr:hypothetical protein GOBAR_DD01014 [Gossypium barbadense]
MPTEKSPLVSRKYSISFRKRKSEPAPPGMSPLLKSLWVRKEKLGDKITALHQLVSPFGKKNGGVLLQEDDIAVSNVRIDLTREGKILSKGAVHSKFELLLVCIGLRVKLSKSSKLIGLELGIDRFDVLAVKVEQVDIN